MPARGFANRSRAALGQRKQVYAVCAKANCYAAGKKTGPYGAYLTRDSFTACRQNTAPPRLAETRFWG
jgi:hypothetical protein